MQAIKEFQGEFRWLSNFWPTQVIWEGLVFPTTENAYQASKCNSLATMKLFTDCTPGKAKALAKQIKIRDNFHSEKLDIMWELNWQKYQYPELKRKLLATGTCEIIEGNTWGDTFWGICDGKGENHLGKILMDIRELL